MDAKTRRALQQIFWLAYRDFLHERHISFCFLLALMAVLAPLLILFGLKFGLIDTLAQRLVESPHNREIIGVGSGHYDETWFKTIAARPEVAFVIPNTRRIAASFSSLANPATGRQLQAVQMIPTSSGDPILATVKVPPAQIDQIVLSYLVASKLGAQVGNRLEARIERRRDDRVESAKVDVQVVGIVPEATMPYEGVFVLLELLVATEDYRDGIAVTRFAWPGEPPPESPRRFARFRLYAKSIYDVATLREALLKAGIEVRTKADEIELMQSLDQNLSRVFWFIAGIGSTGFLASLAANLLANVDRKRRELSVVRLLGFPTLSIVLFPVTQAALIGICGSIIAFFAYFLVAAALNATFASSLQKGELICRLMPVHFWIALLATLMCAIAASAWAGYRAAWIEPAEGIRDV
jgi:putative ABC transport system permease protein